MSLLNVLAGALAANADATKKSIAFGSSIKGEEDLPDTLDDVYRTLTIRREAQFLNCAVSYKVLVNGSPVGKIASGGTLSVTIPPEATIQILCPGFVGKVGLTMDIMVGENPVLYFSTVYGGAIKATLTNGVVVEARNGN